MKKITALIFIIIVIIGFIVLKNKNEVKQTQQNSNTDSTQNIQIETATKDQKPLNVPKAQTTPKVSPPTQQQTEKVQVYVNIVDKMGKPFKPDRVWWYYPPISGTQATEYPAKCFNGTCTRWSVTGATAQKIYVAANYTRSTTPNAKCFIMAYDATPIDLSSTTTEVTLTLEPSSYCE